MTLPDDSVDAIATDPPYGIRFMGREWDNFGTPLGYQNWSSAWLTQALRVLKPGGHLLAFGSTTTFHRMVTAAEDAGFQIRDTIAWMYGTGFPKSHDVAKAIGRQSGEHLRPVGGAKSNDFRGATHASNAAVEWTGWGTALKPAHEPILVARKPLSERTIAANVLEHRTGAMNIDGCRVGIETGRRSVHGGRKQERRSRTVSAGNSTTAFDGTADGRWPANLVLTHSQHCAEECSSDCPVAELDVQSGWSVSRKGGPRGTAKQGMFANSPFNRTGREHDDEGGASRFFFVAKPGKDERPEVNGVRHETVKPLELMQMLVRLVTPPGGTLLDPFAGSGTTVEACLVEGLKCIAIERERTYLQLIHLRIGRALTDAASA